MHTTINAAVLGGDRRFRILAGLLAAEGISISTMMQKGAEPGGKATLILITHVAPEKAVQRAIKAFNPEICQVENMIRVEG